MQKKLIWACIGYIKAGFPHNSLKKHVKCIKMKKCINGFVKGHFFDRSTALLLSGWVGRWLEEGYSQEAVRKTKTKKLELGPVFPFICKQVKSCTVNHHTASTKHFTTFMLQRQNSSFGFSFKTPRCLCTFPNEIYRPWGKKQKQNWTNTHRSTFTKRFQSINWTLINY